MADQRIILSVTELNAEVNQLLSQGFPALWIEGEISNLARPRSGHLYFSLKDSGAQLRCAMFRNRAMSCQLEIENGMKVVARGQVGLYEPRGDYQFIVSRMEDAGEGQLQRQFEALKQKLSEEGLFDAADKQELPAFPRHIGVITSPSGAAIRDILNVLKRRCPQIPVTIYPVAVQGEQAKGEIVKALRQANRDKRELPCDVLILARGGGSLEDLWPFNEEIVARAIHDSALPVISGVGHEVDFTIADFVADQRAPTPSAAAELVSPDMQALSQQLDRLNIQLLTRQARYLQQQQHTLNNLTQRLNTQQPTRKLQQNAQRLDELDMRLQQAAQRKLLQQQEKLQHLHSRLHNQSPIRDIKLSQQTLQQTSQQLEQLIRLRLEKHQDALRLAAAKLDAYSPLATLDRGYSLARDQRKRLIKSVKQVKPGQSIVTQLADGELDCVVERVQTGSLL
ncbi:MAG: exodeoxyribonuclease VII large subunit [Thiolinea sp.]